MLAQAFKIKYYFLLHNDVYKEGVSCSEKRCCGAVCLWNYGKNIVSVEKASGEWELR